MNLHSGSSYLRPDGNLTFDVESFVAPDGVTLRVGVMAPADPVGYVLVLQGRGEFIERYHEAALDLAARGYGTVTFDFRGHGGSTRFGGDRAMGYIRDVAHYVADTRHVIEYVKDRHGIEFKTVLTHSTGGLVAMIMMLDHPDLWHNAIMIAPFFGLAGPRLFVQAARVLSRGMSGSGFDKRYLPGQRNHDPVAAFDPQNVLTSDMTRYQSNLALLKGNPDFVVGGTSAGWLDACFRTQETVARYLREDDAFHRLPPITMVLAGDDQVVSNKTTEFLFAGKPNITIKEIPEARHEILQERDLFRDQFWRAFDQHMSRHNP